MACRKTNIARQATLTNCLPGVIEEADALARLGNVKLALWIESPAGRPYVYKSPGFNTVSRRYRNSYQARICKYQAILNRLTQELAEEKERAKKREKELFEKYEVKEIANLNSEELLALKQKLETLRDTIKSVFM